MAGPLRSSADRSTAARSIVGRRAELVLFAGAAGLTLFGVFAWLGQASAGPAAARFCGLVAVPVLIVASFVYGLTVDPRALLAGVVLLDVEAVLLGAIETGAPFFVLVPVIGIALASSQLTANRLVVPYVAAWLAGIGGMFAFVANSDPDPSLMDVALFAAIDGAFLVLLWQLDRNRARALDAVARTENRFRALLEGVDLYAVAMDRDDTITFINPYALRMTGRTLDEVIGKDWHQTFATPERRDARREHYREVMAGTTTQESERESDILTATGERRTVRWRHAVVLDGRGRIAGLSSIGEDVTAARAAAEAARRASELMETLVLSSPLASAVLGVDRTVQLWNQAAATLFGWTEAEVHGRCLPEILDPSDRWTAARSFLRAIRGEAVDGEELRFWRRDGRPVTGRLYAAPLRNADGVTAAVALQIVDVTGEQALEEKLREAQKMEAIGRLAGGVAHDFNNSLTAIGGFAALIATSTDDARIREDAETIQTAVRRSATLTRALLAYSRRSLLQPETLDVNTLLSAVRPMIRRLLGEDVQLVIESDGRDSYVRVDPGQLEQALLNLAVNARDAMPSGGRLTIATHRWQTAEAGIDAVVAGTRGPATVSRPPDDGADGESPDRAPRGWVQIVVSDTGVGIAPQHQAHVFEPFYTTKPIGAGTGLGLAMVQGFVLQSGGHIRLSSAPGAGTAIEIMLPASEAPVGERAKESEPGDLDGRGETVLFVEDEAPVAAAGFQLLRRRGYRVLMADTGATAIALLEAHREPIALLLLDVILPDMRGPQVAEAGLSSHPEAAVLYASGYSADTFVSRGELEAGVELIEKPYTLDQLAVRVRSAIERHRRGGEWRAETAEMGPAERRAGDAATAPRGPHDPAFFERAPAER